MWVQVEAVSGNHLLFQGMQQRNARRASSEALEVGVPRDIERGTGLPGIEAETQEQLSPIQESLFLC